MRRLFRWFLQESNKTMMKMEPIGRADVLRGLGGKWVALQDNEVVEVQQTPDALYMALHGKQITGATVVRVPDDEEPEMVGLG